MEKLDKKLSIVFWSLLTILMVINFVWMMMIDHPYMGAGSLVLALVFFSVVVLEYKE